MVALHPFCALRYDRSRVPDLSAAVAPPYDVIDERQQEELYQRSPYNIVRLILGKRRPSDAEADNVYTRARRDFDAWSEAGVLRRDAKPAFYLIEHAFTGPDGVPRTRLGFTALLGFEGGVDGRILRHEATLAAPKADRTKLLEAIPANLSPIFCIYQDPQGGVHARLQRLAAEAPPEASAELNGERLRLWAVSYPETIHQITQALAPASVLIADGHHRFEVAYAKRDRFGAVMAHFVSMADPALIVQPIHRLLLAPKDAVDLEALKRLCLVEPAADQDRLLRWLTRSTERGRFGAYVGGRLLQVSIRPDASAKWLMAPGEDAEGAVPLPLATLDVCLLHHLILPGMRLKDAGVRYTAQVDEAIQAVDGGRAGMAWLLRGIPVEQVVAIAAAGFTLPPKSTYFYPKVTSGLTINPLAQAGWGRKDH